MGLISVYSNDKNHNFRPTCEMTLHSSMIGNMANSNFLDSYRIKENATNNNIIDQVIRIPGFYLSEMPTFSFSNEIGENGGAKLSSKLAKFSEGNLLGIPIGELVQNNAQGGGGYVPTVVAGPSTFKVVKNASFLNITLKTRLMYTPGVSNELQPYNLLFHSLMKLAMPAEASELNTQHLLNAINNFFNGVGGTAADAVANTDIDLDSIKDTVLGVAGLYGDTAKAMFSKPEELESIRADMLDKKEKLAKDSEGFKNTMSKIFDGVVKNLIYREYITLEIKRGDKPILTQYTQKPTGKLERYKFVLKGFNVSQSNQLYEDTLNPIWMDFEINLESLGVIISNTAAEPNYTH